MRLLRKTVSGTTLVVVLMVVLPLVCNVNSVLAYNKGTGGTHYFIFDQARTILGNDGFVSYQEFLDSVAEPGKTYWDKMKEGSDEADTWEILASRDHYMSPLDHVGLYIFPFQSKSAATLCQEKFDEALNHWVDDQNLSEAMKDLGWAAHLIQDLCVPFHAAEDTGSLIIPPNRHSDYENWVQSNQNDFAVYSEGEYSFQSFPDRQYYPTGNSGPPSQAYWHYNGSDPTAYDWADYNAHEGLKYYLCVNYATGAWNNFAVPCIETVHNLTDNLDTTWTITMYNSSGFQLHFSRLDMNTGDYVSIYDKNDNLLAQYTGVINNLWEPSPSSWYNSGDTLKIRTTTDGAGASWGFDIDNIKSNDTGDDLQGATDILLPRAQRTTAGFIKFFFDKVLNPIYIMADGSVKPSTAPIQRDDDIYTFTNDINNPIVIEKDNITISGNGRVVQGAFNVSDGLHLSGRNNVTIQNTTIKGFWSGVFMWGSTNIVLTCNTLTNNEHAVRGYNCLGIDIIGNNMITNGRSGPFWFSGSGVTLSGSLNSNIGENDIINNGYGIYIYDSSTIHIYGNNITQSEGYGIVLQFSLNNSILRNMILKNHDGMGLYDSNYNIIVENQIMNTSMYYNIYLASSSNNAFYHNLIDARASWYNIGVSNSTNVWDDGYPSGGNYWSDYTDVDLFCGVFQNLTGNDGLGDSPYAIDTKNEDRYPLIQPWSNDTVAPQVVIHSPYNQTYQSNSIPLTLQINEPSSWIGYSLDGQTNTTLPGKPLSFTYRKSHVINNATGAGTDYQTRIVVWRTSGTDSGENIYVGAKCKPDFGDVRFASSSERLDYWLETYDSLKATFWVKIAGNLSDTTQTIFVYYGSPQATTTSNGVRTFLIFKDLTLAFFQSMGYSSGTYSNTQDPGDYFISSSYTDSTYVNPCIWFRYYGLKQYAVTPTYLYFKGGMDGGNHGNCGMDLRVSNASTPIGWSGSMSYVPNAALDKKHIVVTDYSGTGHLYFYSTFQTYDDIPEGNIVDSYYFNSSSRTASEKVYRGSIAHIMPFAKSDSQLTIYHQYYAAAKYVSSEPIHGSWGNEEIGNACPTLNTFLTIGQDGPHCVIVYANDTVGNIGSSNIVYFTIDTTPPSINIVSPQNNIYYSESIPLTFEINETAFWIGYSLDNQSNVTINGNTMINMEDGLHQIIVYANDTWGNIGSSKPIYFRVNSSHYAPWKTSFIGLGGYPIVDFAVYNGKLYATADSHLYVYDGSSWNIIDAPLYVISLEPYEDKLIVGGQGGLYSFNGATFNLIFTVPTYIKVLGIFNNTLYAGTFLDKPPTLYYCNGSADNPDNWHADTDFSVIVNFFGPFGSIDSFAEYNGNGYVTSGGTVYCYNETGWSIAKTYDDVYAFLDMQVHDGKLYLATRDQGWRTPYYMGYSGFSGRVIEFDGENWTTVFDHDYWIYSLEVYDNKLYAGTANKIYTYNGTSWEVSFNATEGAYYAISMITYDGKIYVGMGNGYIFADPARRKAEHETIVVPEFSSTTILAVFTAVTMLAAALTKKNPTKRLD